MNFSHKGIQNRKHQLESAATHRLHKLQLIGIRLTLIGLIFVGLFAGSFLIGMYTSILSSTNLILLPVAIQFLLSKTYRLYSSI